MAEDEASKWFQSAEMDFQTAIHLYENMYPPPREIICFHCQQAVEKFLKSLLLRLRNKKSKGIFSFWTEYMLMCIYSSWMKDRYFGMTMLGIILRDTIKYAMLIVYHKHI